MQMQTFPYSLRLYTHCVSLPHSLCSFKSQIDSIDFMLRNYMLRMNSVHLNEKEESIPLGLNLVWIQSPNVWNKKKIIQSEVGKKSWISNHFGFWKLSKAAKVVGAQAICFPSPGRCCCCRPFSCALGIHSCSRCSSFRF